MNESFVARLLRKSQRLDARVIYLLVVVALVGPLLFEVRLPPAPMKAARDAFDVVDKLEAGTGKIAIIAADFGPGTTAENQPQAELVVEHLFRKRVPFALISVYSQASPMLRELPLRVVERLQKELPGENWVYGKDWVNLGFQVNGALSLQSFAKAADIHEVQPTDAFGNPLADLPMMQNVHTIRDVSLLVQITGLVGVFNTWLQFFRTEGYAPPMLHGCTSISIPDAYIYYSSKQILGFFEGIAGAAWYDKLLSDRFAKREDVANQVNTGLAFAQLVILVLIVFGNIGHLFASRGKP